MPCLYLYLYLFLVLLYAILRPLLTPSFYSNVLSCSLCWSTCCISFLAPCLVLLPMTSSFELLDIYICKWVVYNFWFFKIIFSKYFYLFIVLKHVSLILISVFFSFSILWCRLMKWKKNHPYDDFSQIWL